MFLRLFLLLLVSSTLAQLHYPEEKRFKNVRQLTFGGENAEGYFSYDDNFLTLQATGYGAGCDQIYQIDLRVPPEQQTMRRISTGLGVCTCSNFYPNNQDILYAGTFHKHQLNVSLGGADPSCPPKRCQTPEAKADPVLKNLCNSQYTWDIYPDFDIFKVNQLGNVIKQLTSNNAYDAEGFLSPDGTKLLFTSLRSGDLELWMMDADGNTAPKQLTFELGYDGGATWSPDGKKIVFRASRPKTAEEINIYKQLLTYDLVAPTAMELYVMNADGTGLRTVFNGPLGGANWAPYYLPDSKRIIFSTNFNSTSDDYNSFDLFIANDDGTGLEQITFDGSHFDSFPMFSRSGKQLVWGSSRNGKDEYEMNLFIADWIDDVAAEKNEQVKTNRILSKRIDQEDGREEKNVRWQDLETDSYDNIVHFDKEKHFTNVKQITFGGENAEGYFSFDDSKLTLQATGYGTDCDQIYELDLNKDPRTQTMHRISTGLGGTTCSFFFNETDKDHRLYAGNFWNITASSYQDVGKTCPPKKCGNPDTITDPVLKKLCNSSYTWDIVPDYDIFKVNKYGNLVQQLTISPGYDAEAVLSPDGKKIAFTSIRSGDLELWIMDSDGSAVKQLTNTLGYDGGSFFSPDGKRLIFRASRPQTADEIAKYKLLLTYDLVEPVAMELFVIDIDGQNMRQITHLGGANWAPYYLNDNKRVIFSSNYNDADNGFGAFALYTIRDDGTDLERITYGDQYQFNSFAMMNYAGTKLVWGSSRNGSSQYELNLFIADWVDPPAPSASSHISFFALSIMSLFLQRYYE